MMDRFWLWVAHRLPRSLVYWTTIRLFAEVTTQGGGVNIEVPSLRAMDALKMWEEG